MAYPTVGTPSATYSGSGTSVTGTPTSAASGDIIVAVVMSTSASTTLSTPSGWTRVESTLQPNDFSMGLWYHDGSASDPTFDLSISSDWRLNYVTVSGGSLPPDATSQAENSSTSSFDVATTSTVAECLHLVAAGIDVSSARTLTTTGTEIVNDRPNPLQLVLSYVDVATASTSTQTLTNSGTAQQWGGIGIMIPPGAPPASPYQHRIVVPRAAAHQAAGW